MLKIKKIIIKNFRSIENMSVDCSNITTFVGANDAGKSNVLRALNLFFNDQTDHALPFQFERDYNVFSPKKQKRAKNIVVELTLELPDTYIRLDYPSDIVWRKEWRENGKYEDGCFHRYSDKREYPPRSRISLLLDRVVFDYVPAIKDKYYFADLQGKLYDVLSTVAEKNLRASSLSFEDAIQKQLKDLLSSVSAVFHDSSNMRLPENLRQIFENLEFNSNGIPLSRRGDGIKIRHIPMILRFIAEKSNSIHKQGVSHHIWGFEEPENNVEMTSCFEMANQFIEASKDEYQIFITTHSPVFYGISETNAELVKSYSVSKVGNFSKIEPLNKEAADSEMGLMQLVTPFINKEREEWVFRHQAIQSETDQLKAESDQDKGLPHIFVEGKTDKLVLERAVKVFFLAYSEKIKFYCGGNDGYGSAEAACSRATAWFLNERHKDKPIKGALLLDKDIAGVEAKRKFDENVKSKNKPIVKGFNWVTNERPIGLDVGFELPVDLEYMYSESVWDKAETEGWLEVVPSEKARLSEKKLAYVIASAFEGRQCDLFNEVDVATNRRIKKQFTDRGKTQAAKWIEKEDDGSAKEYLARFEPTLKEVFQHLFGDFNAH
jgi:predicted ATPase